jgi:hypothetical protein
MTVTPITTMTEAEKAARRLAAKKMGLTKDPEGLKLPDDLWQQMAEKLDFLAVLIATEIIRQNPADSIDDLGDGESLYFMTENPTLNVRELAEKIIEEYIDVR